MTPPPNLFLLLFITEGDISVEGIGQPSNKTCNFRNNKPNVVTFYGDQQVTENSVDFPPGTELVGSMIPSA
jgi:hypothetical protein